MCITREETENKMTARAPSSVKLKNGCFLKEVRGPAEVVTEISASRPKILLIINFIILTLSCLSKTTNWETNALKLISLHVINWKEKVIEKLNLYIPIDSELTNPHFLVCGHILTPHCQADISDANVFNCSQWNYTKFLVRLYNIHLASFIQLKECNVFPDNIILFQRLNLKK